MCIVYCNIFLLTIFHLSASNSADPTNQEGSHSGKQFQLQYKERNYPSKTEEYK